MKSINVNKVGDDWWDELNSDDRTEVELSLKEVEEKKTTPHASVKSRIKTLIDKSRD